MNEPQSTSLQTQTLNELSPIKLFHSPPPKTELTFLDHCKARDWNEAQEHIRLLQHDTAINQLFEIDDDNRTSFLYCVGLESPATLIDYCIDLSKTDALKRNIVGVGNIWDWLPLHYCVVNSHSIDTIKVIMREYPLGLVKVCKGFGHGGKDMTVRELCVNHGRSELLLELLKEGEECVKSRDFRRLANLIDGDEHVLEGLCPERTHVKIMKKCHAGKCCVVM
jgi:hypothetical protein